MNDWPTDPLNLPWEASAEHHTDHNVYVYGGDGDAVITVGPHVLHDQLAIARLAAAVPDLLAALKVMTAAVEALYPEHRDAYDRIGHEAMAKAVFAINRAEGGGEQ